jgi:hypothetical protein
MSSSAGSDKVGGFPADRVTVVCTVLPPAVAIIVMFCVWATMPPITWKLTEDCPRFAVIDEGRFKPEGLLEVNEIPNAP